MTRVKPTRRNKFEIWAEVLEACIRTTRTQSWLLRRIGLKTKVVKSSLNFLMSTGLIEQIRITDNRSEYRTTIKGEEALTRYYQLVTEYFKESTIKHRYPSHILSRPTHPR